MQRTAVVTGAASGMGLATAQQLAARGDRVALFDINADAVEQAVSNLQGGGAQVIGCAVDVADRVSVETGLVEVRAELGPVEIMVTSAGIAPFETFTDITLEAWNRTMAINLTGTFHCLQAAIPDMVAASWGRIVTISSSSAQQGAPRMAHYAASKGGVIALTRALAREYGKFGITANTVPPSSIDTPMQRESQSSGNLPSIDFLAKRVPVGRVGRAEDVAAACVFLCSEEAGYISGQVLGVNGGSVP